MLIELQEKRGKRNRVGYVLNYVDHSNYQKGSPKIRVEEIIMVDLKINH